jgi:integrase
MPRQSKGPRLYLRQGRLDARTGQRLPDRYFIRDGKTEIGTGCGPDRRVGPGGADEQLAQYILSKTKGAETPAAPSERARRSDPDQVLVAEVLAEYAAGPAKKVADPKKEAGFIAPLLTYDGWTYVSDVRRSTCEGYVEWRQQQPDRRYKKDPGSAPRVSAQTARRELECFSTAITHWHEEHHLKSVPVVVLPEKPESPRDALTRSQAAALVWAAMGHRKQADGRWTTLSGSAIANRRHLRRFALIGFYTGTRPGVIPKLLWEESAHQAWVDLDDETIYRRGRLEKDHKTKKRPLVKIPPRLLQHMRRWRAADLRRANELDVQITTVLHHGGRPIRGKIRTGFEGIVRDAGLDAEITPHWMRHTCPTWLMENDVQPWDAAAFTGMSVTVLEKHYGHHRPSHQSAARHGFSRRVSG